MQFHSKKILWQALKIPLIYFVIGFLYILFSDRIAGKLFPDRETLVLVNMLKGWGFMLVTGSLLFGLIWRQLHKLISEMNKLRASDQNLKKTELQLLHAQKMEAVGNLAGGIAHDFNNIINSIMLHYESALEHLDQPEKIREHLTRIFKNSERAMALTRQLLAFSRHQVAKEEVIDLNALAKEWEKSLQRLIGEHIQLTFELDQQWCAVKGDKVQLEQILMNLVINARDAIREEGDIIVKTEIWHLPEQRSFVTASLPGGSYSVLSVIDTGEGMESARFRRIFEPFFTTKEPGKGTGLGLAMVYGIVQRMNGAIDIHSEVGKGTVFKIILPMTSERPLLSEEHVVQEVVSKRGDETILLVEDDDDIRFLLELRLQKQGYKVISAENGPKGLMLADKERIDLMITDLSMPNTNIREFISQMKRRYPELKIIGISGYLEDTHGEDKVSEICNFFLPKPFGTSQLLCQIKAALER